MTLTLLPPAKAQFWGDSWGGRQRQQQNNPFGGWGWGDRGGWENRQYRDRDREYREYRGEIQMDSSRAPAAMPKKDTTVPVVVLGDSMADWLAYGLEDAYSEKPDVGIVRKLRSDSGLIRYDLRRDTVDWAQAAREIIAAEKPKFIVMMVGNNDRQAIREKAPAVVRPAPGAAKQGQPQGEGAKPGTPQAQPPAEPKPPVDAELERPAAPEPPPIPNTEAARQAAYGPWEFHTEKWEAAYIKRIDATMAALKSAGVPVLWVGLPSRSNSKASADSSYLNEIYRSRAEKAGIAYVDVWDGFVDEQGRYSAQGPDYEGQIRRLRTGDGVYFTKYGARKLAHYVEREIERYLANRPVPVALPVTTPPAEANPKASAPTPGAKPSGPPPRPAAGPVLPLTATPRTSEELLGGTRAPRQTPPSSDPTATRVLTKGEPVTAPIGRADDFSWPRGTAADEPAAVTPAAITALSKPPTAAPPEETPDAQQATDAQKAAEAQKRQQAARVPARESGPQRFLFSPQQWFRGFGRW